MMRFKGVLPALVTPLTEKEELNGAVLNQLIEHLLAQGADGFYIGGATGEGIALNEETRRRLAEESVRAVGGRKPCILHVASADFNEAVRLARHAEECGADAISAIPPLFFRYDKDDVYHYYKKLAEAVHIPLMVYYNPNAGFAIDADFAARLFEIENVTAIKWTSPDYYGMLRLRDRTHGEMNIINGPDEMLLMGLAAGADGGIGTTYNIQLPTIRRIYDSFIQGDTDTARAAQIQADRVINSLLKRPTIPATKAALEQMGFAVGNAAFPMKRFDEAEKKQLFQELLEAGLEQ